MHTEIHKQTKKKGKGEGGEGVRKRGGISNKEKERRGKKRNEEKSRR